MADAPQQVDFAALVRVIAQLPDLEATDLARVIELLKAGAAPPPATPRRRLTVVENEPTAPAAPPAPEPIAAPPPGWTDDTNATARTIEGHRDAGVVDPAESLASGFYETAVATSTVEAGQPTMPLSGASDRDFTTRSGTPPEAPPVFSTRRARVLLGALLRRNRSTHQLDVLGAVKRLSSGRVADRLPTKARSTAGGANQVLIERSDSMRPFEPDTRQLIALTRRLCPTADIVELKRTRGTRPPIPTPTLRTGRVLVFTDLAITEPTMGLASRPAADWVRYEAMTRGVGAQPIFIVPYRRQQFSQGTNRLIAVHWSERLSIRSCARAARRWK